jgi:hypothetical protein
VIRTSGHSHPPPGKIYMGRSLFTSMVRKIEDMFEKSNLSPLGIRLLTFLARHPSEEFYLKELAGEVRASESGCHTAIKGLLEDDLVVSRRSGRNVYIRANTDNPALAMFKVFMNIQELNGLVERLRGISGKVVLFGSCATGEDTHRSDIDLLVMTDHVEEVRRVLTGARINGRRPSPIVVTPARLLGLKDEDPALYEGIRRGIVLWGGEHE